MKKKFFQRFGSIKSRDQICQNIWNLKRVWITPKSLSDFRGYRPVFAFVRNDIREFKIRRLRTTATVKHATAHDQNHVTVHFSHIALRLR